jgi:hypothetical protein
MLSWRGAVDNSTDDGGVFILLLPNGHWTTRGASSETLLDQQLMQLRQHRYGHTRRSQAHSGTGGGIEHPCCYDDDDAGSHLDVNDFAAGAPLDILTSKTASIERVPAVMDLNFLPDMGRMTA